MLKGNWIGDRGCLKCSEITTPVLESFRAHGAVEECLECTCDADRLLNR